MDTVDNRELSIISKCIVQLDKEGELSVSKLLDECRIHEVEVTRDKLQQLRRSGFKGIMPTKVLRKELKERLCPFDNLREGQEVYARVNFPESEYELRSNVVSISLITPLMLKADLDYFNGADHVLNITYTPYSYRFAAFPPAETNCDPYYFEKVQDLVNEHNGGDSSLWFHGILYDNKKPNQGDACLRGVVEYTEGRPISREAYLYILSGSLPTEITAPYDIEPILSNYNLEDVEWDIHTLFNPPDNGQGGNPPTGSGGDSPKSLYEVKLYNTGQGNCIYISPSSKNSGAYCKRFFFDIGRSTSPYSADLQRTAVKSGIGDAARCTPDFIILSHWHMDHYNVVYNSRQMPMCPWIAPQIEKRDKTVHRNSNATRLVRYLCTNHLLYFVDLSYTNKMICANSVFSLWRGNTVRKPYSSDLDPNADCLLLQMFQTLLPGDCTYSCWPDFFAKNKTFKYLVVPHHGSSYLLDKQKLQNIIQNNLSNTGKVYVCAGMDKPDHPGDLHMDFIDKNLYAASTGSNWKANSHICSSKDMTDPFVEWDDK